MGPTDADGSGMLRQGGIRPALGFLWEPPREPDHLVHRAEPLAALVRALRARTPVVAVTGPAGVGKSTLAAQACRDRQVRRAFRDGITWLAAGPGRDPAALLAALAGQLGLAQAAAGYAAVDAARDELARALRGKRMLIVLDDVTEQAALDACAGLAAECAVLCTTRLTGPPGSAHLVHVPLGPLTEQQAQELLSHWTGPDPAWPRRRTRAVRSGRAGRPRGGRGRRDDPGQPVHRLDAGLDRRAGVAGRIRGRIRHRPTARAPACTGRCSAPSRPPWPTCPSWPGTGTSSWPCSPGAARSPPRRPRRWLAGRRRWPDDGGPGLLAEFTHRALLSRTGPNHYTAHELHYEVLQGQLGPAGLAAAHARLVSGYRSRYPAGWAYSAADPYLARHLAGHLHDARLGDELHDLLTDAGWIQARLSHGPVPDLIHDYRYARDPLTRQILRTLRLSRTVLAADPGLVQTQLISRLADYPDPGIAAWAAGLARRPSNGHGGPGSGPIRLVRAVTPRASQGPAGRHQPGRPGAGGGGHRRRRPAVSGGEDGTVRVWDLVTGQQQAALTGHTDWVRAVAVTADGARAVSGGDDGTVRVWDLATGQPQAVLTGHGQPVRAVAVTPDGARAVSGGADGSVRVWDLATGSRRPC